MTLSFLFLFGLTLGLLMTDRLVAATAWALRALGLMAPPVVSFDGLLDELHERWPLEADERCEGEILFEERALIETLRRAA